MAPTEEQLLDALACYAGMPGHMWEMITTGKNEHNDIVVNWRCMSCDSERHDTFDKHGRLWGRRYVHSRQFQDIKRPPEHGEYSKREIMRARYLKLQARKLRHLQAVAG